MRRGLVLLAIVGAVILSGVFLLPLITGTSASLRPGDCFDPPTTVGETAKDAQPRPCTEPHGAEVVYVGEYAPATSTYPMDDEFQEFLLSTCGAAFDAFTGLDFLTADEYDMTAFNPTPESWDKNDRKVVCYAVRLDEAKMTQSLKKP